MDVLENGTEDGRKIAKQILDYQDRGFSDKHRVGGTDMPNPDVLPLDKEGRLAWLQGFADGIMYEVWRKRNEK
jgi:hypothetical protein